MSYQITEKLGIEIEEAYYDDGSLYFRGYLLNGKWHRLDGPAQEKFNEAGKCICEHYWLNNKHLTQSEHRRQVAFLKLTAQTQCTEVMSL